MHSRRFYLKFAAIAILMVFLLIPQSVILDLVSERASWREQAYQSIGQSWPGEQTLAGPVLVIPYTLTYNRKETAKDAKGVVRYAKVYPQGTIPTSDELLAELRKL